MNKQTKEIMAKVGCGIGCGILGYLIGKGIERIVLGSAQQEEPAEIEASEDDVVDAGEETENATPVENTAEEKKAEETTEENKKEDK